MIILALDSTAVTASVALCRDETVLAEYLLNNGNTHSENLLPMVEHVLSLSGITMDGVDLLAVTAGPGSFTGVRIGAATVKGLGFGRNLPCIGVSTLEVLAQNVSPFGGLCVPVMNARREQVYTALFRAENGETVRLSPDAPLSLSELRVLIEEHRRPGETLRFCGDGYGMTMDAVGAELGALSVPERLRYQSAYAAAQVARAKYDAGERTTDAELVPTYLRPSQAERTKLEKDIRAAGTQPQTDK